MRTKKLILHIGLHKTGTTHLQATWGANAETMRLNGIWYLPIAAFRNEFTNPATQVWRPGFRAEKFVEQIFENHHTAIFSDENLIGHLSCLTAGKVYPEMPKRIGKLLSWAPEDCQVEICVSIRSYPEWLESSFLQIVKRDRKELEERPYGTLVHWTKNALGLLQKQPTEVGFLQFLERLDLEKLSWVSLLQTLRSAAPDCPITLWPYETFAEDNDLVITLFEKDLGLELGQRIQLRMNSTDSELTRRILSVAEGEARAEDLPKLHLFLKRNFSVGNGYPRPQLIDPFTKKQLTAKYAKDLHHILALEDKNLRLIGFDSALKAITAQQPKQPPVEPRPPICPSI